MAIYTAQAEIAVRVQSSYNKGVKWMFGTGGKPQTSSLRPAESRNSNSDAVYIYPSLDTSSVPKQQILQKIPEKLPVILPPVKVPVKLPEILPTKLPEVLPVKLPEIVPEILPGKLPEIVPEILPGKFEPLISGRAFLDPLFGDFYPPLEYPSYDFFKPDVSTESFLPEIIANAYPRVIPQVYTYETSTIFLN